MKNLVILLSFCLLISLASARFNVCYWGTWAAYRETEGRFTVNDIDPTLCSHIIYAFLNADANGNVIHFDHWLDIELGYINQFIALRQRSPSTKFMFSVGGWSAGSEVFSRIASSPVTRANFAQSVLAFAQRFEFDGFDFDWEYPGQREGSDPVNDRENFVLICMELHRVLRQHGLVFGIAVAATESSARISYDIPRVAANVDFINLMTYDLHGSWNVITGIHGAMYAGPHDQTPMQREMNVHAAVTFWINQGAPRNKLILGLPAYGRSFTLSTVVNNGVGAPANGGGWGGPFLNEYGFLGYNEICTNIIRHHWTRVWVSTQMVPYAFNANQWVGYDDIQSIQYKLEYIIRNNLGGSMWWSIDTEDFSDLCRQGRSPLIRLARNMMMG